MTSILSNPFLKGYPITYKLHALTCLTLGLLSTHHPTLILTNPLWIKLHPLFGLTYTPPGTAHPLSPTLSASEVQQWSNIGILITAMGLVNVVVAAAPGGRRVAKELVGVRIANAVLTVGVWWWKPQSRDLVKALLVLEDGVLGLVTAWQMGGLR